MKSEIELQIGKDLTQAFHDLLHKLNALTSSEANKIPFKGSWTAAQVGDHLQKSYDVIGLFTNNTQHIENRYDQQVERIRRDFLDISSRMKSPEFILPSDGPIDLDELQSRLKEKTGKILSMADRCDLSVVCNGFEHPGYGLLTLLEWMEFIKCHTLRHNYQLDNILISVDLKYSP